MRSPRVFLRGSIGAVLLVSCAIVTVRGKPDTASWLHALVRPRPDTTPRPRTPVRVRPDTTPALGELNRQCETQAARMAAWRARRTEGAPAHEPAWLGHYSGSDDVCYAVIAGKVPVADGEPPLVTELWNGFEATLLATFTSDGRAEMRRDFCRIDLAENPFTSCLVAEFFVRQHLAN
jgi:hypothetical protein